MVLTEELDKQGLSSTRPGDIAKAVISIRQSKLPDPAITPNVGSFFKNPVVRTEVAERLKAEFPEMPTYADGAQIKLAAGWMIDHLGLKGHQVGGFSVHDRQALVLTNDGTGYANDLRELVALIRSSVKATFGLSWRLNQRNWVSSTEPDLFRSSRFLRSLNLSLALQCQLCADDRVHGHVWVFQRRLWSLLCLHQRRLRAVEL